ncbi:MAG: hypothetical protein AB8G15_07720 [Saprospiraceae bacterium]
MKKLLFLFLAVSFFACEKEDLQVAETAAPEVQLKKGIPAPFAPSYVDSDVNNLNDCGTGCLFDVDAITNTSTWSVLNPDVAGYIDYELEEAFECAACYSGCTVRPSQPLQSTPTVEFSLSDSGYTIFDPMLGSVVVYDYLSDAISPSVAEELKEHFACEISNYQNTYFSGYFSYPATIDFYGDALLCTCPSGQTRFLKAVVTFNLHGS